MRCKHHAPFLLLLCLGFVIPPSTTVSVALLLRGICLFGPLGFVFAFDFVLAGAGLRMGASGLEVSFSTADGEGKVMAAMRRTSAGELSRNGVYAFRTGSAPLVAPEGGTSLKQRDQS